MHPLINKNIPIIKNNCSKMAIAYILKQVQLGFLDSKAIAPNLLNCDLYVFLTSGYIF